MNLLDRKKCDRCFIFQLLEDFPIRTDPTAKRVGNLRANVCRSCVAKQQSEYRKTVREHLINRGREYRSLNVDDIRIRKLTRYHANPEKSRKEMRDSRKFQPGKMNARVAVAKAINDGVLIKPDQCSECFSVGDVHGHHWDYTKKHWTDVIWLCGTCHRNFHVRFRVFVIVIDQSVFESQTFDQRFSLLNEVDQEIVYCNYGCLNGDLFGFSIITDRRIEELLRR